MVPDRNADRQGEQGDALLSVVLPITFQVGPAAIASNGRAKTLIKSFGGSTANKSWMKSWGVLGSRLSDS